MKNSVYPTQCFSSQCGLCFSCTNAIHPTPVKHEEKDKSQPKTLSYSEVIGKFEKPRITEMGAMVVLVVYAMLAVRWSDCYELYALAASNRVHLAEFRTLVPAAPH